MEGNGEVRGKKRKQYRSPRRRARGHRTHAYPYELRRKAVQCCLEEGFPVDQVQGWAEGLAHELNHRPRRCLEGQVACRVFQDARPALKAYTRRKRREIFEEIDALTRMLVEARSVRTQQQAEAARRLAVETWLQSNGVITITQNKEVLPIFLKQIAHN